MASSYGIVAHPDGSITRLPTPKLPANPDFVDGVASKDVLLDSSASLSARIFLPQQQSIHSSLPLLLYFHGGGFVMLSVAFKPYHKFFCKLCKAANAIIVAVEYRLAPEHRLPAAHEDAFTSLTWLQHQAAMKSSEQANEIKSEPWLARFADFGRCYLMGDSAGGNIVYHLSLRINSLAKHGKNPLLIQGQIIVQPFFGGEARTESEIRLINDAVVPLSGTDWLWRTALPLGADRDHPFSNPFGPNSSPHLTSISLPPTILIVASQDPLYDRQLQLFSKLKEAGVPVRLIQYEDSHGFFIINGDNSQLFMLDVLAFLSGQSTLSSRL